MAILSSLPGVSVTIHTKKGQLMEYSDDKPEYVEDLEVSQDRVVSNYVEGESGAIFWFQVQVDESYENPNSHPLSFGFEVNGEHLTNVRIYNPKNDSAPVWVRENRGILLNTDDEPRVKRFKFVTLEAVPFDEHLLNLTESEKKKLIKRGIIEVRVCEMKEIPVRKKKKRSRKAINEEHWANEQAQNSSLKRADEKTIERKSMSLGIEYKEETASCVEYMQSYNHPLAVFRFKYRSKADLEKLQILKEEIISDSQDQESDEGSPELGSQASLQPSASMPTSLSSSCPNPSPAQSFAPSPSQSELAALLTNIIKTEQRIRACMDEYEARLRAIPAVPPASPTHPQPPAPKRFEELTEDELRELAKQNHKTFESLEDEEIRRIAREHYKDFADLTGDEVKELARDKYTETRGIKTEVKAEKIIKEEQIIVKSEDRLPERPLADIAPAPGRWIREKRTIDLTLDDDEDDSDIFDERKKRRTKLKHASQLAVNEIAEAKTQARGPEQLEMVQLADTSEEAREKASWDVRRKSRSSKVIESRFCTVEEETEGIQRD